jgi:hypothetical protein
MADKGIGVFVAIMTAIFTLAVVAVILSQKAQTSKVLQALGDATGGVITAATAPVTGAGGPNSAANASNSAAQ